MTSRKKAILMTLVAIIAASAFVSAQIPAPPNESVKQQLTALTAKWLDAERTHNIAFLEKLFAPDYSVMTSGGEILTKAQMLHSLTSSGVKMTDLHDSVVEVRSYGNVALLIDRTIVKGEANNGKPFDRLVRFVRVFVKESGGWRVVYAQASPLKR
ncbi:MAG: nuclear transport factor 2 family protein [Terriglobia bacterium]